MILKLLQADQVPLVGWLVKNKALAIWKELADAFPGLIVALDLRAVTCGVRGHGASSPG